MPDQDTCCTLVPYFKIHRGKLDVFRELCERFEFFILEYGFRR